MPWNIWPPVWKNVLSRAFAFSVVARLRSRFQMLMAPPEKRSRGRELAESMADVYLPECQFERAFKLQCKSRIKLLETVVVGQALFQVRKQTLAGEHASTAREHMFKDLGHVEEAGEEQVAVHPLGREFHASAAHVHAGVLLCHAPAHHGLDDGLVVEDLGPVTCFADVPRSEFHEVVGHFVRHTDIDVRVGEGQRGH